MAKIKQDRYRFSVIGLQWSGISLSGARKGSLHICSPQRARLLWLVCLFATVMVAAQAQRARETVLHNFACPPKGANPYAGVIRDSAGNFYGTTYYGGDAATTGVVYKLDPAGHQTVLYGFTGGADGSNPSAGVIRDSAGNLYGTTRYGGAGGAGVVYKLDPAGNETVLYSFTGGADGSNPFAGVIRDSAGNLYGTTDGGGSANAGVVYRLDAAGNETVLYSFMYGADGGYPWAGVIRDSAGNLYGTTTVGGTANAGVVYKLDPAGNETVLHSFTGGADGGFPIAGVIRDSAGNFYGTTDDGGGPANAGVVYKLNPTGNETVLYSFTGGADGSNPSAGVIRDSAGNLYGTTFYGGAATGFTSSGVVYKLDPSGNETVLHTFTGGADGGEPYAGVIRDSAGNLYGTTRYGGIASSYSGVVYRLDPAGNETVRYSFPSPADGSYPSPGGVIRDSAGNLYGTTELGGQAGAGVVYRLDPSGNETVLYTFTGGADGSEPVAGVIRDSAGNLYGTTQRGGATGGFAVSGVVYKLDPAGNETVLYTFTGGADGSGPWAGVIRDSAGSLYGTTQRGGTAGFGVVYKLDPSGNETVLYTFTGGADGSGPIAGVIRDSAGNLYGTTYGGGTASRGVVYKLDPAGHQAVLYTFTGGADGGYPWAGVIRDSAGNLYGTTNGGGTASRGVVYKLDPAGHQTVLYTFTGGADGGYPWAGVIRDSAGNLYGTTLGGGRAGAGVVYKLDSTGHETVLYTFTGGADGGFPYAGVIRDSAGNLFGTTSAGGKRSTGVVFKLTP